MDKKLQFDFTTTQQVITKIGYIDSFKGKWLAIEQQENLYLKELKRIATIQSIGSSTRIEGATLTNEEIENLLNSLKIKKLETRDEQEAFGYYEVLDLLLENYNTIELNENTVFNLHNLLLKFSNKDERHRGRYKQVANKVVATYPDGKQRIIFNTTEPYLVSAEMSELLNWIKEAFHKNTIHPLLVIGAFIYEFLSIHPFQDGNGRLSRLLTTLLLLQNGYDFIQYISFENHIESKKQEYYRVLMDAQQHRYTKKEIIDKWMLFFLGSLEILIQKLDIKYQQFKAKGPYLNERQKQVLDYIKNNEPIKLNDLVTYLTEISKNTLRKDLQYLHQEGVIEQLGKGKGTTYISKTA